MNRAPAHIAGLAEHNKRLLKLKKPLRRVFSRRTRRGTFLGPGQVVKVTEHWLSFIFLRRIETVDACVRYDKAPGVVELLLPVRVDMFRAIRLARL